MHRSEAEFADIAGQGSLGPEGDGCDAVMLLSLTDESWNGASLGTNAQR